MSNLLVVIRNCLVNDVELNKFITEQYKKTLKHIVGFKSVLKADDYPVINYVLAKSKYPSKRKGLANEFDLSLVLGVNTDVMLDENGDVLTPELTGKAQFLTFKGVLDIEQMTFLVIDALQRDLVHGNYFITSDFDVFAELPPKAPFFNTELGFSVRQSI